MRISDEQLLAQISAKSEQGISDVYDRYARLLYGVILRLVRDTDDAEDVLQEVFMQVWQHAGSYNPALGSVKNWIIRIARNRAINHLQSKRIRQRQLETPLPEDDEEIRQEKNMQYAGTWDDVLRNEKSRYVREAISSLPEDQRCVIIMAFLEGFSHSEIAERLCLPLGTVKTRIRAGLIYLRTKLTFLNESE